MPSTALSSTPGPSARDRLGGTGLILSGVVSLQFGAALAATAFAVAGPVGIVALRLLTSALALVVGTRGVPLPGRTRSGLALPLAMGVVLAVMNTSVYGAIARLPLGVVVTLEFLGPLGVALTHSRRRSDAVLALGAGAGVALTTGVVAGGRGTAIDPVGVVLALVAAASWACYISLTRASGRRDADGGLALASVVAAVLVVPVAVVHSGRVLLDPGVLVVGLAAGVLSSALPYTLDRLALRRLEPGTFGVLMSLHPAVAALAGLVLLDQRLSAAQLAGTALVVAVSAAAVRKPPASSTSRPSPSAGPTAPRSR